MLFLLDIDGVMVPATGWKSPEILSDGFPAFSSKSVFVLQNLVSEGDTVMLTTSHKARYSIQEWKNIFAARGITIKKLESLPENLNNLTRKQEIVDWFKANKIEEGFLIIDDDKSLSDLPLFLKKNLIQTSPYIGLVEEHLEVVKSISQKAFQPA
ncbi:HAD domain-containing protein [Ferruginibacter sp. HRS2-29]|uniref:HAD domain-containing protein n=1 Tax=Ferruginibacter sp. HRS2-29 TaxID=2487334 RepID=UPI0020CBA218|nr:HAD domain-containing protein [Ferruginibacter sp. HRS2-29]MCP9752030.1 hypothetical protein [Ferruginibacter sp. HRS2-29]